MKWTPLAFTAVSLLQLASAQPHRVRHAQHHQLVKKGANVVVTLVDTVYAEPTLVPQVIVYVDQYGNPLSTAIETISNPPAIVPTPHAYAADSSSSPSPSPPSSSSTPAVQTYAPQVYVAPTTSPEPASPYVPAPVETAPPAPAETTPPPPVAPPSKEPVYTAAPTVPTYAPASPGSGGFGLVYSPYKSDGSCKNQAEVKMDFDAISPEYKLFRTYGTDCDQVANVLPVVKARNAKLFAGIYDLKDLESQVAIIVKAANGDWSTFDTVSVGNELVNFGTASAEAVVAAIGTVRALLKDAGYTGYVVTVDTLVAARDHPSLCDASDYCAVNCHPFFDGKVAAEDAGKFLTEQVPTLQEKLADKNQRVVITETGWPWQGLPNGVAIPSLPNQAAAIESIKTAYSANPECVILFTAFNDLWKTNTAAQYLAEEFWGIGGRSPPSG
ncbi:hypothetical protein QTJ16_001983 [Diplocarpon rosae]|uniref:Cell wall glucanase n=1 Tax=Diplocarpon rosae TaxID=946125 RepID=A0AAD9T5W9_9HELO|nr:hypothetical protein QTJ16_001983 [Diplocarpon rosae]